MSATTIAITLIGNDMSGGAFSSVIGNATRLTGSMGLLGQSISKLSPAMKEFGLVALASAVAFEAFKAPTEYGIQAAADLESRLVTLKNALQDDAATMPLLTSAINDLAIRTVFASSDASDAFSRLVQMGFNAQQVMYGMDPAAQSLMDGMYHAKEALQGVGNQALEMAQAMKTDAVTGANLLGSAMQIFSKEGLSAAQTANLLAGAFLNGVPTAEALQQALSMAGAAAATSGVHMDDFLATLDLLVRNGMSASSAGASLRYALQSLTAPTDKQKLALKDLGLVTLDAADQTHVLSSKLFDAQGNFIGLKGAVDLLDKATIGKTAQEKMQIFADLFNVRSGRAAMVLTNIQQFDDQYNSIMARFGKTDVTKMAEAQLNTLLGAWGAFKDSFTSLMANIFLPIIPYFTQFILKINDLIGAIITIGPETLKWIGLFLLAGTVIAGIIMVVTGVIFIIGILVAVLGGLGIGFGMIAGAVGIVVGIIALAIGVFVGIKTAIENNKGVMDAFNAVVGFLGQMLGMLKDQGMQLLNSLHLLLPVWDVLKVVLIAIAVVIGAVLVAAIAIVIGVLIALTFIIRNAIQWFAAFGSGVGAVFSAIGTFVSQVPGWFQQAWNAVVKFVQDAWNTITTGVGDFFSNLGTSVQNGLKFVQDLFNNAVKAVVGFFEWLYNHNYYFKDLVDFIKNQFNMLRTGVSIIWNGITSFLSGVWNGISGTARAIWTGITSTISSALNTASSIIHSVWNAVSGFFSSIWNTIVGIVSGAVSRLVGAISGGVGQASGAAHNIVAGIQGVINTLGGIMLQAGANAMHMLAQGIANAAGAVLQKARDIADQVKRLLGFHSPPPEGPLADSDQYMPNMMKMFASGMDDHLPTLNTSLNRVGALIGNQFTTPRTVATAGGYIPANQSGTVVIPITLDGKQIAQYTLDLQSKQLTMVGGSRYAR